jgi:DNA-directed RNA polymerase sigma subunit (sigma70/sigma32)
MKTSDEQRLGKSITTAQERLRLNMCQSCKAADWHLTRAAKVVQRPKLLERFVPHLEGDKAKQYLADLPGWIEQTKQQEAKCLDMWSNGRTDYDNQQKQLISMLLRYSFSLRSYERLARQANESATEATKKPGDKTAYDDAAARMTPEAFADLEGRVQADLELIDKARAELMAGHEDLIEKLAKTSDAPEQEAILHARHGMLKAAENFDSRQGHRFAAYAKKWIKAAIKEKVKCDE